MRSNPLLRLVTTVVVAAMTGISGCGDDGTGPGSTDDPICSLSADSLSFEYVTLGNHLDKKFVIKNIGSELLSGQVSESHDCYQIIEGEGPFSIDAGDSLSVLIRFEPLTTGAHSCNIQTGTAGCGQVYCCGRGAYEWTQMESNIDDTPLYAVWGSSGSDVFAAGWMGTIVHYNGSIWSPMSSGVNVSINDIWGSSGSDVYAVGNTGVLLHYNGSSWSEVSNSATEDLLGIDGISGSDIYAVGDHPFDPKIPEVLHFDGDEWSSIDPGLTWEKFVDVWCNGMNDIYVASTHDVYHFDGSSWIHESMTTSILHYCIWGLSESCIWTGNAIGSFDHFDGSEWMHVDLGREPYCSVYGIWGTAPDNIYAVGYPREILHYDGESWRLMAVAPDSPVYAIWGTGDSDIFAVGDDGLIIHYGP